MRVLTPDTGNGCLRCLTTETTSTIETLGSIDAVERAVDLAGAALVAENRPVFLELAVLPVVDVDLVWQVLADHHATVCGEPTGFGLDLTPEEAFEAWSRGTLALDGYLRAVSPEAAARVLESATDFAEYSGSLAGIDSVFLTAFTSAARDLTATGPNLDHAAWMVDQVGMPPTPGGGATHTLVTDAAHDRAALVDHHSLAGRIWDAAPNFPQMLDILAREGVGVAASASQAVIPGSGGYVKEALTAVVSTGEGAAWGAAIGSAIPGVGTVLGAIGGAVASFVAWVRGPHGDAAAKDAAKGEKVPVSPPAPVTQDGHTTKVGADGTATAGRPTGPSPQPPPGRPPGPKAAEAHCPRPDEDTAPELLLAGWNNDYSLIPTLGPHGMDALIGGVGAAVLLPAAAQISWDGGIAATGVWGDLMIDDPTARGTGIDEGALLGKVTTARHRAELAEALIRQTDPSVTLHDALATLRAGGPGRDIVGGES